MAFLKIILIQITIVQLLSCDFITYKRIEKLEKNHLYDIAREKYQGLLNEAKDPKKISKLHFKIANTYIKEKNKSQAELSLNNALSADQGNKEAKFLLSELYIDLGKDEEAIKILQEMIIDVAFKDKLGALHIRLGKSYMRKNLSSQAEKEFSEILNGEYSNKEKALGYYYLGSMNLNMGEKVKSVEQLKKSIELDSALSEPYLYLAIDAGERAQYNEAQGYLVKALELNPEFAEAHYNMGLIYTLNGDMEHAVEAFENALRCDFELLEAHLKLAEHYTNKGNVKFAKFHLDKIKRVKNDYPNLEKYYAKMYIASTNHDSALKEIESALKKNPLDLELKFLEAKVLTNLGNHKEALKSLLTIEKNNANFKNLYSIIGDAYLANHDSSKAKSYYLKELSRDEKNVLAYLGLAKVEAIKKNIDINKIGKFLNLAVKNGFKDFDLLRTSPYFDKIMKRKEILEIVK